MVVFCRRKEEKNPNPKRKWEKGNEREEATKTKKEKSLKNLDVKNMTTVDYMKERKVRSTL